MHWSQTESSKWSLESLLHELAHPFTLHGSRLTFDLALARPKQGDMSGDEEVAPAPRGAFAQRIDRAVVHQRRLAPGPLQPLRPLTNAAVNTLGAPLTVPPLLMRSPCAILAGVTLELKRSPR